jgi:hypothetical protein
MSGGAWEVALDRAREATRTIGWIEEQARRRRYTYSVDFDIEPELVDVKSVEIEKGAKGCHIHMVFEGNDESKSRVLDVLSQLPSVRRSYRMHYESEGR